MSALHWICALTLALIYCLSAQPIKRSADDKEDLKEEIIEDYLKKFREVAKNKCPNDTEIYSPTDIDADCLYSALNCTLLELDVIKEECELGEDQNDLHAWFDLSDGLNDAMNKITKSPSSCTACENYPKTDVEKFLDAIQTLVEQW